MLSRGGRISELPQDQHVPAVVAAGCVMFWRPQSAQSTMASRTDRSASRHCDSRTRAVGWCRPTVKLCVKRSWRAGGAAAQVCRTVVCSTGSGAFARSAGSKTNSGCFPYSRFSAASSRQWMSNSLLPLSG